LDVSELDPFLIPEIVPTFGEQSFLTKQVAEKFGLSAGTPVTYRAGDQPNNAFSLNVLNPGEIAATAGTSGVVYGVTDKVNHDPYQRINTFAHINHTADHPRYGVLLCINGTGISNSWIKKITKTSVFELMNQLASAVKPGSEGLLFVPFGNGAERMLGNSNPGAGFFNIDFNLHNHAHLYRAVQEGVAFAFKYGIEIMQQTGIDPKLIRAGQSNMFQSEIFGQTLANLTSAEILLCNTDGSLGAARGAALGAGFYRSAAEAYQSLSILKTIKPDKIQVLDEAYKLWKKKLSSQLQTFRT
ncbi:MAG: carbohydrate kinase, partial [Bacteroidales bacterium]|nr:carbohydrate kinase [Bacteroidales bacterium]